MKKKCLEAMKKNKHHKFNFDFGIKKILSFFAETGEETFHPEDQSGQSLLML